MQPINYKTTMQALLILLISLYSSLSIANVTFSEKPEDLLSSTVNPVNKVSSGSIIYYLPSSGYLAQVALDTKVQMNITGTINRAVSYTHLRAHET